MRLRAALLSLVSLGIVTPLPAVAQQTERPRIVVAGEASVSVEPDMAQIRAGVTSDAKTAREAAEVNAKAMTAVMNAVRGLGIPATDVQTSRYSIQPIYESAPQARNRLTGFQATNSVLIKVRQIDKIDDLVDNLVSAGANTMGNIEFIVSEPSRHLDDARRQAIDDARRKAQLYAEAAGIKVGPAIEIVEQSTTMPPQPMMMARGAPTAQTPIAPGERTLRLTVSISYEILR
jgi:uncharacterized protein